VNRGSKGKRTNRQWVVAKHPVNNLSLDHFGYREEIVPEIVRGEVLLKAHYLNVAPVMRTYMMADGDGRSPEAVLKIGDVIHGRGVAEVIESKNTDFDVGDFVHGQIGWQTHKVSCISEQEKIIKMSRRDLPVYYGLSALGMTGYSAYCGFVSRGQPEAGEAVLVSGAAGGVGSLVVQIAKALGCAPIIGLAGSDTKCAQVLKLGADSVINYRSQDVAAKLTELVPQGLDIYFDNVGGRTLDIALDNIGDGARIVLCGSISEYQTSEPFGPKNYTNLRRYNADMRGFFVYNYRHEFGQAETDMAAWIKQGQLRALVHISDGFKNMPNALIGLYAGENIGKSLVRVNSGADVIY